MNQRIPSEKLPSGESWELNWDSKIDQPYLLLEDSKRNIKRINISGKEAMQIYFAFGDDS